MSAARKMQRFWGFVADIEEGIVVLTPMEPPGDVFAGNVAYRGSDGSEVVVFNDCNSWDYFDSITLPDGTHFDYDSAASYRPTEEVAASRYGITEKP